MDNVSSNHISLNSPSDILVSKQTTFTELSRCEFVRELHSGTQNKSLLLLEGWENPVGVKKGENIIVSENELHNVITIIVIIIMTSFVASFSGSWSTIWGSSKEPERRNTTPRTQLALHLYTALCVVRFLRIFYLIPAQSPLLPW
jgi:hypothetical protein